MTQRYPLSCRGSTFRVVIMNGGWLISCSPGVHFICSLPYFLCRLRTVRIQTDPYCTLPTICHDNLFLPDTRYHLQKAELSGDQCNAEACFIDNNKLNSIVTVEPCQIISKY